MRGAQVLKKPLPSVFAADLRAALNESVELSDLKRCADLINAADFLDLPRDERTELVDLYQARFYRITGALV